MTDHITGPEGTQLYPQPDGSVLIRARKKQYSSGWATVKVPVEDVPVVASAATTKVYVAERGTYEVGREVTGVFASVDAATTELGLLGPFSQVDPTMWVNGRELGAAVSITEHEVGR